MIANPDDAACLQPGKRLPLIAKYEGTFHITGGTGQYKGATGEAELSGEAEGDPDGSGQGWVKFKGYFIPLAPII